MFFFHFLFIVENPEARSKSSGVISAPLSIRLSTFSFASTTYATISTPLCFASTINSSSSSSSSGTTRSFMDYRDASSLMFCRVPLSFLGIETCRRCHHHRLRRGGVDTGAAATHRQKSAQRSAGESRAGIVASSSSALLK